VLHVKLQTLPLLICLFKLAVYFCLGAVLKDVRSHGEFVQYGHFAHKGVLQMRTSALFGGKTSNFWKFMVCPHRLGGLSQCGQGGRRVNFSRFCAASFMDGTLQPNSRFTWSLQLGPAFYWDLSSQLKIIEKLSKWKKLVGVESSIESRPRLKWLSHFVGPLHIFFFISIWNFRIKLGYA